MTKFDFFDESLPTWLNVIVLVSNIIGLIYNIPQIWTTFRRESTEDISGLFLLFRLSSGILWLIFSFYVQNVQLIISNAITTGSTIFIGVYKIKDLVKYKYVFVTERASDDSIKESE
jgi:uncharacterized protein with PQ loop repeat